jgi:hypothetical protein
MERAGRKTGEGKQSGERDFRKKDRSGSGARSGRSGNGNGAVRGISNVINFLKSCAGTRTRRTLSSCD